MSGLPPANAMKNANFMSFLAIASEVLADSVTNFVNIPPSGSLQWRPCYQNFTCANLLVPLDYADMSAGFTNIAFLKDDALIQLAKDIVLNPGGPGASGVNYIRSAHTRLRKTFGPQYNIIGFDPRAVNNSGPHLDYYRCMETPMEQIDQSEQAWCKNSLANGAAKYVGTVAVVQDLLNFIELRSEELGEPPQKAKLSFYGASYGTTIGTTFAAMYPQRVERMILDAVMDGEKYYKAERDTLPSDTLDVLTQFAPMCFAAGPERCVFHGGSNTVADIEARIEVIYNRLSSDEGIFASGLTPPYVMAAEDLTYVLFMATYNPMISFPDLAEVFADLENGEGRKLLELLIEDSQLLKNQAGDEGQSVMIQCLDPGIARSKKRLGSRQSTVPFARLRDMLDGREVSCGHRNILPPPSQQFFGFKKTQTSFPILFLGTSADPVTPIRGAHEMSEYFPGSVVLKQDSIGHSTLSSPSVCTSNYIRGYLAGGMPRPGMVCQPDRFPFDRTEDHLPRYGSF